MGISYYFIGVIISFVLRTTGSLTDHPFIVVKKCIFRMDQEVFPMKISSEYVTTNVAGQTMVVPVGDAAQAFRGIIRLNETAKFIWDALVEGLSEAEIVEKLTETYEVDAEKAQKDVSAIIEQLHKAGILEL